MASGQAATRTVIISPHLSTEIPDDPEGLLLPNRQAARSLGVPYRSLEGLARRTIQSQGLRLAPKVVSHRTLRRAVARAGGVADPAGMARAAEGTLRELLRAGLDLEALREEANPRISRLAAIATTYRRLLAHEGYVDAADLLWRAAQLVNERRVVHLRGFPRLPAAERAFLDAVAAPGSTVCVPLPHDQRDNPLFGENREALRDFRERGWDLSEVQHAPAQLGAALARTFLSTPQGTAHEVRCYGYPDLEAEVRGALSQVKRLLRAGTTADRIAVVARDEESYGPSMLAVAEEYGVPLRVLYGVPLNQTRLGAWLGELVAALANDLPFEATARLLAHPLVGALDAKLWSSVRERHTGGWEAWSELLPLLGEPWPESARREEYTERLERLLERLGAPGNARSWARGAHATSVLLEELRVLPNGSAEVELDAFVAEVDELVRLLTVPAQPGRGGVELHTPLSLFGARVDHLFVVGAAEGLLPSPVRPDPLLDPFEREELRGRGFEVEDVAAEALREELSFWALLHSAGETLTLSLPRLLGRSEALPSPYLARLGVEPLDPPAAPLCSPRELRRAELPGIDRFDETLERARRAHEVEARRESDAPYDEHDGITGVPYLPPAGGLAVTGLVSLASCPYRFFGERVLRLAEPDEAAESLDPSLRGRLFHEVLQLVMEAALGSDDPRAAAQAALGESFALAEVELDLVSLPTWPLERSGHLDTLRRAIAAEPFIAAGARVRELERSFQGRWRGIPVRGRVDRIDELPDGLELIDYKSGSTVSNLAKDSVGRPKVDLQLSIYRESAAAVLASGEPVAGSRYFSVSKAQDLRVAQPESEELDRLADEAKAAWKGGSYPVDPDIDGEACRYCPLDPVCRKGPRLERKRHRL